MKQQRFFFLSQVEAAWAAGLFEGEGTIRINSFTKQNTGALIVSIVNTDKQIIDWFHVRFGGYMKRATGLDPKRQRPAWVWVIAAKQAAAFIALIEPHLVTDRNRERARTGLMFQKAKRHRHHQDANYLEDQWCAYMWMKELNARGAGPRVAIPKPEKRGGRR